MSTSKIDLVNKLKELMQSDNEYERKSAEDKLKLIMNKYDIDESELDNDKINHYTFYYHNNLEKTLLVQTIIKILGFDTPMYKNTGKGKKIRLYINCTYSQYLEISMQYDFYVELMKEELDVFIRAFVYKHNIFPSTEPDDRELSDDEIDKIMRARQMMQGMKDKSYIYRIEG